MGFNSGFKGLKVKKISGISWPLKMGPIGCPETSVRNYHSALRDVQEESRFMLNGLCCLSPRDTCFLANYAVSDCGLECEGLCHVFTCMRTTALLYLRVCVPQPYCIYVYAYHSLTVCTNILWPSIIENFSCIDWIELAKDMGRWLALLNAVMNLQFP